MSRAKIQSQLGRSISACLSILFVSAASTFVCCGEEPVAKDAPHVVVVVGTTHYSPERSMPLFTKELERLGFRTTLVMGEGDPEKKTKNVLPGIEALATADVAIFYMRFLQLPDAEWKPIEDYLKSGKPIIGLRTSTHAFKYPADHPRFAWNMEFGRRAMGTPYIVHQASLTNIELVKKYNTHPILGNIGKTEWTSEGKLYLTRLQPGCVPLLTGTGDAKARIIEREFGAIAINETESDIVAWTWKNEWGGKVFGTSFGHLGDFAEPAFTRMLVNSVYWAVDQPIPDTGVEIGMWTIPRPEKKKKLP